MAGDLLQTDFIAQRSIPFGITQAVNWWSLSGSPAGSRVVLLFQNMQFTPTAGTILTNKRKTKNWAALKDPLLCDLSLQVRAASPKYSKGHCQGSWFTCIPGMNKEAWIPLRSVWHLSPALHYSAERNNRHFSTVKEKQLARGWRNRKQQLHYYGYQTSPHHSYLCLGVQGQLISTFAADCFFDRNCSLNSHVRRLFVSFLLLLITARLGYPWSA